MLNPGVILPAGEPSISRLKVGSGAAPLPADIARSLRDIERDGGYARRRLELADAVTVASRQSPVNSPSTLTAKP